RSLLKKERHKILESIFTLNPYPPKDARKEISQQLQMDPREFQIWFQNRRCREKKKTSL
ncbi:homeobox transcription factor Rpx-II, partial [Neoconidiobolus thromboides FSU 785]